MWENMNPVVILLGIILIVGADPIITSTDDSIFKIEPKISDKHLVENITKNLFESNGDNLPLSTISNLFKLSTLSLDDFWRNLSSTNINVTCDILKIIELNLNISGMSFNTWLQGAINDNELYKLILEKFDFVGVDPMKYVFTSLNNPGEEFNLIKHGNYTAENIDYFLTEIQKTDSEIFEKFRNSIVETYEKSTTSDYNEDLFQIDLVKHILNLQSHSVTLVDLKTVPQYRNETDIFEFITSRIFNGILVDGVGVITTKFLQDLLKDFITITVLNLSNSEQVFKIPATEMKLGIGNYSTIPFTNFSSSITLDKNTEEIRQDCEYIVRTDAIHHIPVEDVNIEPITFFIVMEKVHFVPGAPLVCNGTVYGISLFRDNSDTGTIFNTLNPEDFIHSKAFKNIFTIWLTILLVVLSFVN